MKRIKTIIVLLSIVMIANAQNDTTFYYKDNKIHVKDSDGEIKVKVYADDNDSPENLLFEGNYDEANNSEINFTFSKLLKKTNPSRAEFAYMVIPGYGPGFEFSALTTRSLKMNGIENAQLSSAYGFNIGILSLHLPFMKHPKLSFYSGVGLKMNWYNSDSNTAFRVVDGITRQVNAPEGMIYSKSWLYTMHLTIPVEITWKPIRKSSLLSLNAGMDLGFRLQSKSNIRYRENGEKRFENLAKGLNVNPVSLDLKLGLGIYRMELYVKYGLISLFKKDKGPDVIQSGWGVAFKF